MTCDRCPLSLVCLGGSYVIHKCNSCHARVIKPRNSGLVRETWYTVRCHGKPDANYEHVYYADCPRCHPCDYEHGYGFGHLHVAKDGSILMKTHSWWCKRQVWWLYRDHDEPLIGFAMPKPVDAP